ncbi:MAG: hypothetical protein OQK78_00030 [Gammaproteobacteria bacterium]|nr:hypothetical protein [Gammaproteobacteria bacterium]
MNTLTIILIVLAAAAALFYLLMKISINRSISKVQQPPAEIPDDMVKCFSCGHVVPVESALEKKGRYFCGLKKSERDELQDE